MPAAITPGGYNDNHTRSVKRQLEDIVKDTKILCELEPFVKKWSISEILPSLESPPEENDICTILRQSKIHSVTDPKEREKLIRKMKEIMEKSGSGPGLEKSDHDHDGHLSLVPLLPPQGSVSDSALLGDQYDRELESTLTSLKEIEEMDPVTEADIECLKRGLCQPDGPDLHRTNLQEWKHIFLEHWLNLDRHYERIENKRTNMSKHKGLLPTISASSCSMKMMKDIPPASCNSKVSLHSHFVTRKKAHKNLEEIRGSGSQLHLNPDPDRPLSSRPTTTSPNIENTISSDHLHPPPPTSRRRSLLSLKEEKQAHDVKKMASSATAVAKGVTKDHHENRQNYYHQQRQRIRNCVINKNIVNDKVRTSNININSNKISLLANIKGKVNNPPIRPSSAIPPSPYLCSGVPAQPKLSRRKINLDKE